MPDKTPRARRMAPIRTSAGLLIHTRNERNSRKTTDQRFATAARSHFLRAQK
jgi:hypothetical protein